MLDVSNQSPIDLCPVCCDPRQTVLADRLLINDRDEEGPYALRIARCGGCSHVYQLQTWNEAQLQRYYYAEPAYYRPDYSEKIPESSMIRFESVLADLMPYIEKTWRHLDVGGYTGQFSYFMAEHLDESHCLDVSIRLPAHPPKNVKAIKGTLANHAEEENNKGYDLISLNHTLEHLTDLQAVRKMLDALLKPGGFLLIEVPDNLEPSQSMLDYSLDHTQYFTAGSLFKFLSDEFRIRVFRHLKYPGGADIGSGFVYRVLAQKVTEDLRLQPEQKQTTIEQIIHGVEKRIKDSNQVYVWGSGFHTRMLFSLSEIIRHKTCNLIDSDITRQGKVVFEKEVVHPQKIGFQSTNPVIISSFDYRDEIAASARSIFPPTAIINPYAI